MKRVLRVPIIFWILVAFLCGTTFGAVLYTLILEGDLKILPYEQGDYTVKAYYDLNCTEEVTRFNFGEVSAGDSFDYEFYLKNIGNVTIHTVDLIYLIRDSGWGGSRRPIAEDLAPNEVTLAQGTIYTHGNTDPGDYVVELKIECCG